MDYAHRLSHPDKTLSNIALSKTSIALLVASVVGSPTVMAQQNSSPEVDESSQYERVIVTSRKRSESMNDVPISINVVSEGLINNLGASDFTDLLGVVPSLTAYQNGPGAHGYLFAA